MWIAVTNARDGIEVIESLARRRISATLVVGRDGCRVRVAESRIRLLFETAVARESSRPLLPPEAA